jgi:DNA sulfur modification protein DndD
MNICASIDQKTFKVTLFNDHDQAITRDDLSAGESQIYAISILAALARTSGRNLPIIIDTPLARLDSKHRKNLIENYFPYASQQVIILSTDTEVDEEFYQGLYKHMSHAYMLEYNPSTGSSVAEKGYFWRTTEAA